MAGWGCLDGESGDLIVPALLPVRRLYLVMAVLPHFRLAVLPLFRVAEFLSVTVNNEMAGGVRMAVLPHFRLAVLPLFRVAEFLSVTVNNEMAGAGAGR
jgi:ribosomal protein S19